MFVPGVQRRRDGEPRLRDVPRHDDLPRGRDARRGALSAANTIAHEMAHMWFGDLVTMTLVGRPVAQRVVRRVHGLPHARRGHRVHRRLGRVRRHPQAVGVCRGARSQHPPGRGVAGARRPVGARQLRRHLVRQGRVRDPPADRPHRRRRVRRRRGRAPALARVRQRRPGAVPRRDGVARRAGPCRRGARRGWRRPAPTGSPSRTGVLDPHPAAARTPPTARTRSTSRPSRTGAEVARVDVVVAGERTPVPGLDAVPAGALVVPNAADLTWAEVSLDPATLAALPAGLADVPDAQARAVLWVALLGAVHRAEVDPRVVLEVFADAWPRETSAAVLSRAALATTTRVVPMFLPAGRAGGRAGPGRRRGRRAARAGRRRSAAPRVTRSRSSPPGCGPPAVPTSTGCGAGRRGDGIPAVLTATTTSAGRCCGGWRRSTPCPTTRSSGPRPPTAPSPARSRRSGRGPCGRPPRPRSGPGSALRDDAELSNYAALAVAGGFWVTPDPELVRPYVEQVGDLVVTLSARMGDDARLPGGHRHPPHPAGRRRDRRGIRRPARARRPHPRGAARAAGCRPRAARGARQPPPVRRVPGAGARP